jgi:hypothetical protein
MLRVLPFAVVSGSSTLLARLICGLG